MSKNENSGIYKITCLPNNKLYIGSSKNIEKRFKTHINQLNKNKHINEHLQSSWNLYGQNNFLFEIIETCEISKLIIREQYWLDSLKSYNREIGFNACIKADCPLGYKHNDTAKEKMSKAKLGKKLSREPVEKIRQQNTGKKRSESYKNMMSISRMGQKNPMFGKKLSEIEKIEKGRALNSVVPRWNKGLTKDQDPRILKLATWKGKTTINALKCKLTNIQSGEYWIADSITKLSKMCPISLATLNRLKNNTAGMKYKKIYKLEILCK